jgi:hypothetical protein
MAPGPSRANRLATSPARRLRVVYHVAVGIDHEAPAMLKPGDQLPEVGLRTAAGERVRLSDHHGRHLVVQCLRYYG